MVSTFMWLPNVYYKKVPMLSIRVVRENFLFFDRYIIFAKYQFHKQNANQFKTVSGL